MHPQDNYALILRALQRALEALLAGQGVTPAIARFRQTLRGIGQREIQRLRRSSSSQASGIDTGAPGKPRGE